MSEEFLSFGKDELIAVLMSEVERTAAQIQRIAAGVRNMTPVQEAELEAVMKALAKHPFNTAAVGEPKMVAGRYHFPLRRTIISVISITAAMTASGFALVGFPPAGIAGMAGSTIAALQQLSDLVTNLSDVELLVLEKLLDAAAKQRASGAPSAPGSTLQEIEASFNAKGEAPPPTLPDVLQKMTSDKVIKVEFYGSDTRYVAVR